MESVAPRKSLDTFDIVCLGINGVIGTGIFILPGLVAQDAGKYAPVLYVVCGFFCFSIALCYAEMGGMFTRTGGAYVYAYEAFGPLAGFMVGWQIWMASLIGWASVANGFLLALDYFHPGISVSLAGKVVAAGVIGALSLLNFLGVKMGASASNLFTVSKMLPLLLFVVLGLPRMTWTGAETVPGPTWKSLCMAFLSVLYIFTGFEHMTLPASEVKEPQKTIPRSVFIVLSGVAVFYVVIQAVFQNVPSAAGAWGDSAPLARAALGFMGPAGGVLMAAGAVVSIAGINSGMALTGPRSIYALARDGFLPPFLSRLHPAFNTPYMAIAVNAVVVLFLTVTGTYAGLVQLSALASLLQYIPTCLAVIVLRKKLPDAGRGYVVPGGAVIPVFGVITCVFMFLLAQPREIAGSVTALLISLPVYFLSRKFLK